MLAGDKWNTSFSIKFQVWKFWPLIPLKMLWYCKPKGSKKKTGTSLTCSGDCPEILRTTLFQYSKFFHLLSEILAMIDQADTRTTERMINVNLTIQKSKLTNPYLHSMIEKNTNKVTRITRIITVKRYTQRICV